ncbi:hypothetical protein [Flavihumibacter profundi]|jgi:hypothetical protein|uniref:hypothetical protein n=1 Tax=Flavihumibacter profundi TaxID=2716883 RepID=UPI001CC4AB76|nr:hypothetical protein [Flavihumibacter profundi]MBZ5855514.1 hypothetical protein [Flavihumibacter profundi]
MKHLLTTTAAIEAGTGLALIAFPSPMATILLGTPTDTPVALTVARAAGVAIFALAAVCWLVRNDGQGHTVRGLVSAVALYNAGIIVVLAYGGINLGLSGIGLWPTVGLHGAMAAWCVTNLLKSHSPGGTPPPPTV